MSNPQVKTPRPGDAVLLDTKKVSARLFPCDDWDAADFRIEGRITNVAVNVEVTGRRIRQVPGGGYGWRVKVTFVGDGEPDTTVGGWMYNLTDEQRRSNLGLPARSRRPFPGA